jgi:hypothetical protein
MTRRLARFPLQHYRNRDYVLHMVDDRYFDALNPGGHPTINLAFTGCIDALDNMPAGGMEGEGRFYDQIECERGVSLAELQERAAFLDSLLAELDQLPTP